MAVPRHPCWVTQPSHGRRREPVIRGTAVRLQDDQSTRSDRGRRCGADPDHPQRRHHHSDAIDALVDASGGYPYYLQEFGKAFWNTAPATPSPSPTRCLRRKSGASSSTKEFFPSRWTPITDRERRYRRAMTTVAHGSATFGGCQRYPRVLDPQVPRLVSRTWAYRLHSPWDERAHSPAGRIAVEMICRASRGRSPAFVQLEGCRLGDRDAVRPR